MRRAAERGDVSPIVSDDLPDPPETDGRLQITLAALALALDETGGSARGNIHDAAGLFDPNDPAFLERQRTAEEIQEQRTEGGSVWR